MSVAVGPYQVAQQLQPRGAITEPTTRQVARVQAALLALDDDVSAGKLLPRGCRVLYGYVAKLPGGTDRAIGYTTNRVTTRIRWGMQQWPVAPAANPSLESTIATALHETLGHASAAQLGIPDDVMDGLLQLLDGPPLPAYDHPNEVWVQAPGDKALAAKLGIDAYWLRPYEGIMDSLVPALSDVTSSWHGKYQRRIPPADYDQAKALWMGRTQAAQLPPDPPDNPELPTDPPVPPVDLQALVDELRAQVAELEADAALDVDDARNAAAAAGRIVTRHPAP